MFGEPREFNITTWGRTATSRVYYVIGGRNRLYRWFTARTPCLERSDVVSGKRNGCSRDDVGANVDADSTRMDGPRRHVCGRSSRIF